jgi:hypothetical protein
VTPDISVVLVNERFRELAIAPGCFVAINGDVVRCVLRGGSHYWIKIAPLLSVRGYLFVLILIGQKLRRVSVHSLILSTFGESRPNPFYEAFHIDGNRGNNNINNLGWRVLTKDHEKSEQNGILPYSRRSHNRLSDKQVVGVVKSLARGDSIAKIAKRYGVAESLINKIKSGRGTRQIANVLGR